MTPTMDAIDTAQQKQIDATQVWTKVIGLVTTIVLIAMVAMFALVMETRNCPHPECSHHRAAVQ